MSEENTTVETEENVVRGDRGEIGSGTISTNLKRKWHEACFKRVSARTKHQPNRTKLVKIKGSPSLKQFAVSLADSGDEDAVAWFNHKSNALEKPAKASRAKNKGARIAAEKSATKNARRKNKTTKKDAPATTVVPTKV